MEPGLQLGVGPVPFESMDEWPRFFAVQTLAQRVQLARRCSSLAEHREVVLIAQIVRQVMELVGELADRAGRQRRQNLQLMPQVLGLLAPLVQILGRTVRARGA